jgi:hypothetical protein
MAIVESMSGLLRRSRRKDVRRSWILPPERILAVFAVLCACGESGEYDLAWTVDGVRPDGRAPVCAQAGVDAIESLAVEADGTLASRALWRCREGSGVDGVAPGEYRLFVSGLAPDGQLRVGPFEVPAVVVEDGGRAHAAVDLITAAPAAEEGTPP